MYLEVGVRNIYNLILIKFLQMNYLIILWLIRRQQVDYKAQNEVPENDIPALELR